MARIPESEVERLKSEVSLVRLIEGAGHTLKPQGKDLAMPAAAAFYTNTHCIRRPPARGSRCAPQNPHYVKWPLCASLRTSRCAAPAALVPSCPCAAARRPWLARCALARGCARIPARE
jgi:hypothetical protein